MTLASACNRVDAGAGAPPDATGTDAAPDFAWPRDEPHPRMVIEIDDGTTAGTMVIELIPELAPRSVAIIADLAKNGYYEGTTFHRVIPGFMIQGGDPNSRDRDPNNDGYGDSDLAIDDEFSAAPFERGVVGLGNTGRPNSTGGQIFIMLDEQRSLDGRYTVIGRVVSGMDVVDAVARVETDRSGRWGPKDRPVENVRMTRVSIEEPPDVASVAREDGISRGAVPQGTTDLKAGD